MRCLTDLHAYQRKALKFIKEKKKCALWLDMGLGKTVVSWTAIAYFLENFQSNHV